MAVFLQEDMIGTDDKLIGFPHLVLCMGVVLVMGDGSMIGAHFTQPKTEQPLLRTMLRAIQSNGSGMRQLYCVADLDKHIRENGGLDINGKAKGLAFTGQGHVVDLGVLKPTDGSYAQVVSNGADSPATVRCKLNEFMDYTGGLGPKVTRVIKSGGILPNGEFWEKYRISATPTWTIAAAVLNGRDMNTPYVKPVTVV